MSFYLFINFMYFRPKLLFLPDMEIAIQPKTME